MNPHYSKQAATDLCAVRQVLRMQVDDSFLVLFLVVPTRRLVDYVNRAGELVNPTKCSLRLQALSSVDNDEDVYLPPLPHLGILGRLSGEKQTRSAVVGDSAVA